MISAEPVGIDGVAMETENAACANAAKTESWPSFILASTKASSLGRVIMYLDLHIVCVFDSFPLNHVVPFPRKNYYSSPPVTSLAPFRH